MQAPESKVTSSENNAPAQYQAPQYQAPLIESVITSEEMEREVAYAGGVYPSGEAPA